MKKQLLSIFSLCTITVFAQWTEQASGFSTPSRGVNSIDVVNASTVWAGAYDGTNSSNYITEFTRTSNGGSSWSAGIINTGITGAGIGNISAISDSIAWACIFDPNQSNAGGIWKTTDAGTSWTQQTSAAYTASSFPNFVYFWDANNGITVGDPLGGYFEVYTTADGGTTWTRTANTSNQLSSNASSEYGYTDGFSVSGNTLWFNTNKGYVFKTADKGFTFTKSQIGNSITDCQRLTFADANNGYAAMRTSNNLSMKLAKTIDGGATWTALQNNTTTTITEIFAADIIAVPNTSILVTVGSNAAAKGSTMSLDGGVTWSLMEDTSLAPQRLSVDFIDASTGWAGSFNQNATTFGMSKFTAGTIGIKSQANSTIAVNLYPNPAKDVLTLSLNAMNGKSTVISLFNLLGEKIAEENVIISTPVYYKHFNISNLNSGVYFISVNDGTTAVTQKFIKQ